MGQLIRRWPKLGIVWGANWGRDFVRVWGNGWSEEEIARDFAVQGVLRPQRIGWVGRAEGKGETR